MNKWALCTKNLQASSRCQQLEWAHGNGHTEASVNRMHNLERRWFFFFFLFYFLQGLEILAVSGSYFIFKIILSLFLVIGRGRWRGGGVMLWWLAETGWRCCHVGACRKGPAIMSLSVTWGPNWCGCDGREREGERKKQRMRKWVLGTLKQLVNSVRLLLF